MQRVDLEELRRQYGTYEAPVAMPDAAAVDPVGAADLELDDAAVLADCHRVLSERQVTAAELRRKLAPRHDAALVEHAIDRCTAAGLLDDARYVASYVASRIGRGQGAHRIRRDLLRRGIDRSLVDAELARHEDSTAIDDAALEAARRKFGRSDLADPGQAARLVRWLGGRGYEPSQAWSTLERLRQEQAATES